jgi:hypothetical protein
MARSKESTATHEPRGEPKYPYTPKPGSLRRFLQLAPTKPRPKKITGTTLQTWGFADNANDRALLRVLKALELLGADGTTTEHYAAFMQKGTGPSALGARIRATYPELFENYTDPGEASAEELTNFFNIHSGGSEKTIEYQVQTLKALADSAEFDGAADGDPAPASGGDGGLGHPPVPAPKVGGSGVIHIDLHVHLPENKSKTEYDAIFESIAQHIIGKKV